MPVFILRLSCPDQMGVVASISQGLVDLDANILQNADFSDPGTVTFCMRTRFEADVFEASVLEEALRGRAAALGASFGVRREDQPRRALLLVSKYDHCLLDLLYRRNSGEFGLDIPLVVSNHPDLRDVALRNGVVAPGVGPQRFRLELLFRGDGRTFIDRQIVEIVIPGADGSGCDDLPLIELRNGP